MLVCDSELVMSYFSQNIVERSTSSLMFILRFSEKNEVKTNAPLLGRSSPWISVYRITLNNPTWNQNYHIWISKNPMKTLVFPHNHLPNIFCFLSQQSHICKENCDNPHERNQRRYLSLSSLTSIYPTTYKIPSMFFSTSFGFILCSSLHGVIPRSSLPLNFFCLFALLWQRHPNWLSRLQISFCFHHTQWCPGSLLWSPLWSYCPSAECSVMLLVSPTCTVAGVESCRI